MDATELTNVERWPFRRDPHMANLVKAITMITDAKTDEEEKAAMEFADKCIKASNAATKRTNKLLKEIRKLIPK